jgi:hypothetical protein
MGRCLIQPILGIVRHLRGSETSVTTAPTETDGAIYGITGAIDRLQRLAMAIRQSPRTNEVERVRNFASKQPPDGFYNIILARIQYLFPEAERTLQVQLAESIIYRRHRLLWNRRHSKKLRRQRKQEAEEQSPKDEVRKRVAQARFNQNLPSDRPQRPFSGAMTESILSSTQISQRPLSQSWNKPPLRVPDAGGQEENRSTRSTNPHPRGQYPNRPPGTAGETKIICHYCLAEVDVPPAATTKWKDKLWRLATHLMINIKLQRSE